MPYLLSSGARPGVTVVCGGENAAMGEGLGVGPAEVVVGYVMQQTGRSERNFSALLPYKSISRTDLRWLTITWVHGIRYLLQIIF